MPNRFIFICQCFAFWVFQMGVKIFWTATIVLVSPRRLLLLHHNTFVLHRAALFCCTTKFLIAPRCPSFAASRYFQNCTNFFYLQKANAGVCGLAGRGKRLLEDYTMKPAQRRIHARPAKSAPRKVRHIVKHLYRNLPFSFISFNDNSIFLINEDKSSLAEFLTISEAQKPLESTSLTWSLFSIAYLI